MYTPGWTEALWELSVLPKNTTQWPRPGLEPGPLDLEVSAPNMRPPPLHDVLNDVIEIMIWPQTVSSPLEWTLYQLPPHLKVLHHTRDRKHLLRSEKYATQQNLAKINMARKRRVNTIPKLSFSIQVVRIYTLIILLLFWEMSKCLQQMW